MDVFCYTTYILKPFIALKKLFFTIPGLTVTVPSVLVYIKAIHIENQALILGCGLLVVDFVTGILVSFKQAKDKAKETNSYATKQTTEKKLFARILFKIKFYSDVIESSKLRLSVLKIVVYMFFVLGAKSIQMMFMVKPFQFSFSEANWTITLIAIGVCCLIEIRSIVVENFKKLGFDLIGKILSLFKSYKEIKKEFND